MTKYPFKFLDAYNKEDEDIFFGRETEIDTLYEMVFETNILFLYGASGTGKTSLLRCGLANRFKETHWSELFVLRGTNLNTALLDAIRKNTPTVEVEEFDFSEELENTEEDDIYIKNTANNEVIDALQELYRNTFNPIYLIFDQFEELFILGKEAEQQQFIQTVKDILQADVPCRLLFSVREEYLANLYEFEKEVPQLLDKKLRVARMNYRNAQEIVLKATNNENSNIHLEKGKEAEVARAIIDKIREGHIEIQLPIFQMMMDSLYVKATGEKISRTKEATFDLKLLEDVGTIEDLLASFLNDRANMVYHSLNDTFSNIPKNFVWQFLSPFATLEGTKIPLSLADINEKLQKYPAEWRERCRVLLEDNRILRYQEEGDLYSLMHDVLAKEVAKRKDSQQIAIETAERLIKLKCPIWKAANQDAEKLLPKGDLAIIAPWLPQLNLRDVEKEYVQKSQELADAELIRLKEEAIRQTKLREAAEKNEHKAKRLTRVAIGVMVFALMLAGVALFQFFETRKATKVAENAKTEAIKSLAANIKNQKKAVAQELINYAQSYCDLDEKNLALKRLEAAKDTLADYSDDKLYKDLELMIANPCQ